MAGLDGVQVTLVDSVEKASEFMAWLSERRPYNTIAVDIETGEKPGNPEKDALSPWHGDIRLVQVGDGMHGWAIPWGLWQGIFYEAMRAFDGQIVFHNIAFEAKWFAVKSTWDLPWERAHDTMIMAHIIDPLGPGGLKPLSAKLVDPMAAAMQSRLDTGMLENGWTWGTVPIDYNPYWCVPLDTEILTREGWKNYSQVSSADQTLGYEDGFLKWTNVKTTKKFKDAPVVTIENKYWSTTCTPNHRFVYESATTIKGKHSGYGKARIGELKDIWSSKRNRLVLSAPAEGGSSNITPDEAAVIAWLLSDGSIYWQKPTSSPIASITQSPKKFSDAIRDLLIREGAYVSERYIESSRCISFYIRSGYVTALWNKANLHNGSPSDLVLSLSREARKSWWDAWYMAEGGYRNGIKRGIISQNFGPKFDALVLTVYMEGFIPRIQKVNERHGRINCGIRKPTPQKHPNLIPAGVEDVWCPVTDSGTWTARDRDGRVFVTGNTYAALDTILTMRIWEKFYEKCGPGKVYHKAYELEMAARKIVTRMEINGARVDLEYAENKYSELIRYTESVREWGARTYAGTSLGSNIQLVRLFESLGGEVTILTDKGAKSCDKDQLTLFKINGSEEIKTLASTVLDLRKADKLANTYFLNIMNKSVDGILHPNIKTLGARTSRMTMTDPALQTLPKEDGLVRGAFIPKDDNHVLITSDLDQVEFRMFASLSKDKYLIDLFNHADRVGSDPFTEIGREVYQDPSITRSDSRRGLIKGMIYGRLYGAGIAKQALTAGVPEDQMRVVSDAFDKKYPGMIAFQREVENIGMRRERETGQGYVNTWSGRRLPCDSGRIYTLTNYLIQGSAAEIFKNNLIKLDQADLTEYLVLPVHDEIVLNAPRDNVEEIKNIVKECMTTREGWAVPLTAGVSGPLESWGENYK